MMERKESTLVNSSRIKRNDVPIGVGHGSCFGFDLWGAGSDVCG